MARGLRLRAQRHVEQFGEVNACLTITGTTMAGYTIDHFGSIAFYRLAFIAFCGLALVWLLLPETRPDAD